jgi:Type II secretion system (T2SS), protein G
METAKTCIAMVLLILASILTRCGLPVRIDTYEELSAMHARDIVCGLMFTGAFLLARLSANSTGTPKRDWVTTVGAFAIFIFVAGGLIGWHEALVRVRDYTPRTLTSNRIRMAQVALHAYAEDCGRFPTKEQGLAALCTNPGIAGWKGPYLTMEDLTDAWGNPLQYSVQDKAARVWSSGPDGISGTDDDIHPMNNEVLREDQIKERRRR